jgi:D-sedoheptulose 7-phosphate isomerase
MKETTREMLCELCERYPALTNLNREIESAFLMIKESLSSGGVLYCGGNGGSASDCEHIVGELIKSFKKKRDIVPKVKAKLSEIGRYGEELSALLEGGLRAVSLQSEVGILSAFANDRSWDAAMAQRLYALGRSGDVVILISTSGNSKNCLYAATLARAMGIGVIALTGEGGGELAKISDVAIKAPETETYKVQELHLPIYHCIAATLEEEFF